MKSLHIEEHQVIITHMHACFTANCSTHIYGLTTFSTIETGQRQLLRSSMNTGYASTWNVENSPNGELFQLFGVQVMHDAQVAEICNRLPQIIRCERPLIFNILCLFGKPVNNCRIVHRHLFALHTWLLSAPSWQTHSPSSFSLLFEENCF